MHMQWAEGKAPPPLPEVVRVRVENYRGPPYFEGPPSGEWQGGHFDRADMIPIVPPSTPWTTRQLRAAPVVKGRSYP